MSADRILAQLLGNGAAAGFAGGLAGGLLTSKAGRKLGKKALQVGGIAAVGGLAYAAFARSRATRAQEAPLAAAAAATSFERFVPGADRPREQETRGRTILRAMVAAAHADGQLDPGERRAIRAHVNALPLSDAERTQLLAELGTPASVTELVAGASTPEIAAEIYTASLLAIELDTPAERAYLAMLAARLELPAPLVESIHRELEMPAENAAELRAAS